MIEILKFVLNALLPIASAFVGAMIGSFVAYVGFYVAMALTSNGQGGNDPALAVGMVWMMMVSPALVVLGGIAGFCYGLYRQV